MIVEASRFVFRPPPAVSRARRILIKPSAHYSAPYPVSTSPGMLAAIIEGIRQVSDADILILEGTPGGAPVYPIYRALGYDFPRVLMLDVRDCTWVEVDNPLPKALAVPAFWIPNVVISSDYLISVAPLKVVGGQAELSITNLLTVLPSTKYNGETPWNWKAFYALGIERVIADLYFTLPFDLGIIEARQKFVAGPDPTRGEVGDFGKVFVGEPYEIDREATEALGLRSGYLDVIKEAKVGFEA